MDRVVPFVGMDLDKGWQDRLVQVENEGALAQQLLRISQW